MNTAPAFLLASALLLSNSILAVGQVVHPSGASVNSLNWQPMNNPDVLAIDVDGDSSPDIEFSDSNQYPNGAGQPTFHTFTVSPYLNVELALDSAEYDSAHRYQSGQPLLRNARWSSRGGYVAYTVLGNGGLGGRGFFRDGQLGYVAVRKNVAGTWRYWWFNVQGRNYGVGTSVVNFYGQSATTVSAVAFQQNAALLSAFPNPAVAGWTLQGFGHYQLVDATGRVLKVGTLKDTAYVDNQTLSPGLYWLLLQLPSGQWLRQPVVKQ